MNQISTCHLKHIKLKHSQLNEVIKFWHIFTRTDGLRAARAFFINM